MNDKYEFYLPVAKGEVKRYDGKSFKCTHVKCALEFDRGGSGFMTGGKRKRGYCVSVDPVNVRDGIETCVLSSGVNAMLVECERKSRVMEAVARTMFETHAMEIVRRVFGDGVDVSQLPRSPTDELKEVL